ncbi:AAA family ATPase [Nocardia tengchongensis]|uniref:helix-turn-helix transcriptional regulator n=1 Tax=Nocardia tengchongensis TaxID=2055889 RepID=UPI0036837D7C
MRDTRTPWCVQWTVARKGLVVPDIGWCAVSGVPLLGRDGEVERVVSAVGDPARVILVRGEAGIGKSRVLDVVCQRLVVGGWNVVRVGGDELDRPVAYSGLRAALAEYADPARECGVLTAALVNMLDVAAGVPVESIVAVTRALFGELTEVSPVALAVDDLELLDADTLALVGGLLHRRGTYPLVLLGNLRSVSFSVAGELPSLLDWARVRGYLREVEIGPLGERAIRELVAGAVLPAGADAAAAIAMVAADSGGNPLFAMQSLLEFAEFGIDGEPVPGMAVADRRRAFLDRVLRVDHPARLLSRAVALMGRVTSTRMGVVSEMTGLSPTQAAQAFDVLVERRILVRGGGGDYRVAHHFLQDVLCGEIGPAQRWHWQRLVVEHLYSLPPSPESDLEIAAALHGIAEIGDDRAIEVLARAAVQVGATAPRAAVPLFERALALTRDGDPRTGMLKSRLAGALLLAARPRDAATAARAALESVGSGDERARLVTLAVDALVLAGEPDEAADLIDAEVALPGASARLLSKAAHVRAVTGRPVEELVLAAESGLAAAPVAEQVVALGHLIRARALQSNFGALPDLWGRLDSVSATVSESARLGALTVIGLTQAVAGDTAAASATITRAQGLLAESNVTLYREDLAIASVHNALNRGDWSSALSIAEEISGELRDGGQTAHHDMLAALTVEILAHRGEFAAAARAGTGSLSTDPHVAALQVWASAGLRWLSGDVGGAREILAAQLDSGSTPLWHRARLRVRQAVLELDAGVADQAARIAAEALGGGVRSMDHQTYIAARLVHGRAVRDRAEVLEGIVLADAGQFELLRGQGRLWLGELGGDSAAVVEAARIFGSLGAAPWRRRAVVELRHRGLSIPRDRGGADTALTEIETQIARLVQQGRRNREIAETVFLSVKTVERYLTRVYEKTATTSRFELARALDGGLLD